MTAAEQQFSAHEACVVILTERNDEMRDHLDQARLRLQAAESQIQAGGTTGGHVKFTLSKEMMPDSFNGTDRMKFSDREFAEVTSKWETSWSGSRRNRMMYFRTSLTC